MPVSVQTSNLRHFGIADFETCWHLANDPEVVALEAQKGGPKRGSNRARKFRRFGVFSLICNVILMPNWGFNYSKMAKYRFLIDSNTFLTILGTSKIFTFYGSWPLLFMTILLQKIQEKIGNHLRKSLSFHNSTFWNSKILTFFGPINLPQKNRVIEADFWCFSFE